MKRYAHISLAAIVAGSLAASTASISHAGTSRASTSPPKLRRGVTIKLDDFFPSAKDTPERVYVEKLAAQFTKKYGIKVSFGGSPSQETQNLCTQGPGGTGPDIVGYPDDQLSNMVQCRVVAPVPEWAWPASQRKGYISAAIKGATYKGKIYAMPFAVETTGIYYNKAMVSPSLFKPKKGDKFARWSTIIAKAKTFGVNKGIGWDIANLYFDYFAVSGNGGYVFKYKSGRGFMASQLGLKLPGTVKGFQFMKDITDGGKYKLVTSAMSEQVAIALFGAGKLAMDLTGPWNEATFRAKNINFGFAPVPSFDGKHPSKPFSGVQQWSVNRFSKYQPEAFAFLRYLVPRMQVGLYKINGRPPVSKKALASPAIRNDPVGRGVAAAALAAQPMPNIPEMAYVWARVNPALTLVVQGKATPAQAAQTAYRQVKADIAKAKGG